MIKITIIHFQPLELYPPIQNLINHFEKEFRLRIISIHGSSKIKQYECSKSRIIRPITIKDRDSRIVRFIKYLYFNSFSILYILFFKPDRLLYIEPESSYPCYIVKKYIFKKLRIYIHYHEFIASEEYRRGMELTRFFHSKEYYLYKKADWISHTNQYRIDLFKKDYPFIDPQLFKVLPNYPPKSWQAKNGEKNSVLEFPIKLLYIGSLSLQNMYTKEIFDWIVMQNGKFVLDVYSINIYEDVLNYLNDLNCSYIFYKGAIEYNLLPSIIAQYDVGLILYKAVSKNYIYNKTNKLFEYLMCGLDVWYSSDIIANRQLINTDTYPKVICVDFNCLENFDFLRALDHKGMEYKPYHFNCEDALTELKNEIYK